MRTPRGALRHHREDTAVLDVWNRGPRPEGEEDPDERTRAGPVPATVTSTGTEDRDEDAERDVLDPGHYVTYPGEGR
jgi:hypothetical protein